MQVEQGSANLSFFQVGFEVLVCRDCIFHDVRVLAQGGGRVPWGAEFQTPSQDPCSKLPST